LRTASPIVLYLVITYIVVAIAEGVLLGFGLLNSDYWTIIQWTMAVLLAAAPAIGAFAAAQLRHEPGLPKRTIFPVPAGFAVGMVVMVQVIAGLSHGLDALIHFQAPAWDVPELVRALPSHEEVNLPQPLPPMFLFGLALVVQMVMGGTLYALFMAGHEVGWRGYMQEKLAAQGRLRAYLAIGAAWGAIGVPIMVYSNTTVVAGLYEGFRLMLLALAVSVFVGEVWRRSNSLGLAAVVSGSVVAGYTSTWDFLFPNAVPALSSATGWFSIGLWAVAAVVLYQWKEPVARTRKVVRRAPASHVQAASETAPDIDPADNSQAVDTPSTRNLSAKHAPSETGNEHPSTAPTEAEAESAIDEPVDVETESAPHFNNEPAPANKPMPEPPEEESVTEAPTGNDVVQPPPGEVQQPAKDSETTPAEADTAPPPTKPAGKNQAKKKAKGRKKKGGAKKGSGKRKKNKKKKR